jgi:hypothetical protein
MPIFFLAFFFLAALVLEAVEGKYPNFYLMNEDILDI